ncbi:MULTISPECIES: acyl-CoA dehydrogenase family protein [Nocardiopsis]|uniref:glutaryl-CoA dehydrogenase (ETF) n=1 Tax=Nocardiopsis dassonvillei (strain ATCC 23218 / DSM 43111 / CIP 107115 / JCM 7437 / KCTC 9190 / NBRC 14626 / NCTC 10488 / NRRL B-5397 / IMRU 509) TaxID=446468 RepID=D7AZJ6_NOCDD|nr:acyl-CoA dehydrogenase family protein [Nocardiopsis dassonvillei]ADH66288.1 acyl-CoA dehydrogenase domain protein [Nocardiopsis dassonvillei subsp. dassonvillei DSM 43111]APC34611.1 acyl-CoA dehydrogenase [Nocardiopsis dassonvillei]NKY79108.1 acyl-CoA dehydrogenase [Nocardiopsis dassonvillei]VEI92310.1 Acyl-CoA dehydrogenase, short-chain specific [Nocardiopsis dassonvillei]
MSDSRKPAAPDPHDFLAVDADLSDTERDVRDAVRGFASRELAPNVAEWFEAGTLPDPRGLARAFGSLGVLGMHLEGYGCGGSSAVAYGLACRELEAVDSGLRSFVSVQGSLAMAAVHKFGSEEQKQEWLPRMAAGEAIGCFGLTEPDSGSDPGSMRTRARRDGSDWVLDGTKMWITNGSVADVAVVWAATDEGVRGFVVPADTPGFSANVIHRKLSLRASITSELVLEGVRLPADAVLPGSRGLGSPLSCLNEARYGIVWGAAGAARACYEAALEYALSREQFGRPIAGFQLTQRKLADMVVDVNQAAMTALRIGRLKDEGRCHHNHVSFGKLSCVAAAQRVAAAARSVHGANGITLEYPVMRHMLNLETVATYEGTEEIHALSIGQSVTGISAFR